MKKLLSLLLVSLFSLMAMAHQEQYAFKTEFANKVIYVDSLGLPGTMSVGSLLQNIPELLTRPGENLQDRYEVWINGMAVGGIYDMALTRLQLADVEKIEITEMSRASYEKMGGTGGLNIILRSKPKGTPADSSRKWWGNASLGAGYTTDIAPHVQVNYNTPKFYIKGITFGEYGDRSYESSVTGPSSLVASDNNARLGKEFVGFYAHWQATDKDVFDFNTIQSYNYNRKDVTSRTAQVSKGGFLSLPTTANNDTTHATSVRFKLCYNHTFSDRIKLEYQGQLIYGINKKYQQVPNTFYSEDGTSGTFTGTLNATFRLFKDNDGGYGDIKAGADYNLNRDNTYYGDTNNWSTKTFNATGHCTSLMPFVRWEYVYKKFQMQAELDYLYFSYRMWGNDKDPHDYNNNNVAGYIALEQQVAKHHHLRLYYERRVKRPKLSQSYFFTLEYPAEKAIYQGNPDLLPTISNQINLDWIARYNIGKHSFTIDLGGTYERQSDVIKTISDRVGEYTLYTYDNSQTADIYAGNLMVCYRYECFSCTFGGRLYHKTLHDANGENHHTTYTNLSLTPGYVLPNGWNASAYIAYFSRVKTDSKRQGDIGVVEMKVGKTIGRWDPYLFLHTSFTGNVTDTTYSDAGNTDSIYQLVPTTVGLGLRYNF